jgi:hypothetical protein
MSVLSDMEISNPEVLKVKVKIVQNEYNEKEVQVFVRDHNNRPVDLYSGKVMVNGCRAPFERAQVHAAGTRGYIYVPDNWEQAFEISVYWNEYDAHSFYLGRNTGFPGFFYNEPYYDCGCDGDVNYRHKNYDLKPAPFHDNRIQVEYKILD